MGQFFASACGCVTRKDNQPLYVYLSQNDSSEGFNRIYPLVTEQAFQNHAVQSSQRINAVSMEYESIKVVLNGHREKMDSMKKDMDITQSNVMRVNNHLGEVEGSLNFLWEQAATGFRENDRGGVYNEVFDIIESEPEIQTSKCSQGHPFGNEVISREFLGKGGT